MTKAAKGTVGEGKELGSDMKGLGGEMKGLGAA